MDFNKLYWHDAIIKNIELDRKNPGLNDTISLEIEWPNNQISKIIFTDVYFVKMNLNFGIMAPEAIYSAFVIEKEDDDITNFYIKWKGLMDDITIKCYVINTLSTGSEIKILAKNFEEIK
jgi:hypothetical protein